MDSQHASNSNSALVATLEEVPAAHNPFLYSVEKYVKSHASQKLRILPENHQGVPNGVSTWQLPKLGYLCDATLSFGISYDNTYAANANGAPIMIPTGRGLLSMIRRITWSNENREILSLSQNAIMALYSDLSYENRVSFGKAVQCRCDPLQSAPAPGLQASDATQGFVMCELPLQFVLFSKPSLFANLSFLAPCQIKVHWESSFDNFAVVMTADDAPNNIKVGGVVTPATTVSIEQSTIMLTADYVSLPQAMASETIEKNFGSGSLSTLVWDMEDFPIQTVELPFDYAGDWPTVDYPLSTTKALSDLYVMAYIPRSEIRDTCFNANADARIVCTAGLPLPLASISLTASGQNIIERVPASELRYWGRRTDSGVVGGYWATSGGTGGYQNRLATPFSAGTFCPQAAQFDSLNGGFIYKINLAALTSNKNYNSGMLSARELQSLMLHIELAKPITDTTWNNAYVRHGVDYPLCPDLGNDQPFLSAAADNKIKMSISVIARTNSIINCDGSSGRCQGLLSN